MDLIGSGSQRAMALIELYARLVLSARCTLVVDSLTRRFKGRGACTTELVAYLGLPTSIVAAALDEIPSAICYRTSDGNAEGDVPPMDDHADDVVTEGADPQLLRYFINYRTAIPWIVAHTQRMFLALCRVDRNAPTTAMSTSGVSVEHAAPTKRGNDGKTFYCSGCTSCFDTEAELRKPGNCSICNLDIVESTLQAAQAAWRETEISQTYCASRSADGSPIPHTLRMDPYVLQQALAVRFLCSSRFCFVDAHHAVVDPDAVMTEPEFYERSKHRSSLALQFRAKHRSGKHLHLVFEPSVAEKEARAIETNTTRLEKRQALPPWLRARGGGVADTIGSGTAPHKRVREPAGDTRATPPSWQRMKQHAEAVVCRSHVEIFDLSDADILFERPE
jgi:hypothetical protein